MPVEKKSVISIKWGTAFTAEDVNVLKRAASDNCTGDLEFFCLTDDSGGLDQDITALEIPIEGLDEFPQAKGIWGKMCLFHPRINKLFEHGLFLDIDTVIVDNIYCLFENPGTSIRVLSAGPRWRTGNMNDTPVPATGVFCYAPAHHNHIFENFRQDPNNAYQQFDLEQEFVGFHSKELEYFPVDWIDSFKYHLRRPPLIDLVLPPKSPNPNAKLVAFHGFPRPQTVAVRGQVWAKFPHSGMRRPKWLIDYWTKYSG